MQETSWMTPSTWQLATSKMSPTYILRMMHLQVLMRIRVQIDATRKTIHLDVESTDTIHIVKAKIQAEEDIPTGQQVLFLPHKQLQDSFTHAGYYIQNKSTFYLAHW
ncbi:putative Ubiquitin-like domain-containing protein [Helianthus debilis subsp. tardiflorus]